MSGFIAGSVISGGASYAGAREQAKAADRATAAQERAFNRQIELQEPFRQAGVNALPELIEASRYTPFGMEQFQADPGYGFRLKEGLRALENSAAARGGLLSGNAMRGITRYGQGLASDEYTNAFNRYQAERAARLNPLQSLAGMGQSNAATMAQQAGQYGQNMAENAYMRGNMRASGYANVANALTGGLSGYLNRQQTQDWMDRVIPPKTPAAQTPYTNTFMFQNDVSNFEGIPGMGGG
jgi:hypothetical protein